MKKALFFLLIITTGTMLFAQQRHALVIGNNNYTSIRGLTNAGKTAVARLSGGSADQCHQHANGKGNHRFYKQARPK